MKMVIVIFLVLVSSQIFASKARMEGLGQDSQTGSFFLPDPRSVFLNPGYINIFNNYIITEWGEVNQADGGSNGVGTNPKPNAEGGFFQEVNDFTWGVYLGNKTDINDNWKNISGNKAFLTQRNPIDIFFGGDAGLKWGSRLSYANSKNEKAGDGAAVVYESNHTSLGIGFGLIWENLNMYTDIVLKDKSVGADEGSAASDASMVYEGDLGLKLGAGYQLFGVKLFGQYETNGFELHPNQSGSNDVKYEQKIITIGAGKIHEVANNARIITDATINVMSDEGNDSSSITSTGSWTMVDGVSFLQGESSVKTKKTTLNLTFGLEADATSWLTLRGSVKQASLINQHSKTNASGASFNDKVDKSDETTSVSAGATINFGSLKIDGLIGTGGDGVLNTDNLLVRTALHYWF